MYFKKVVKFVPVRKKSFKGKRKAFKGKRKAFRGRRW